MTKVEGRTFRIFGSSYEVRFCEGGDAFVGAAAATEARKLEDEECGDDFVVLATYFHLETEGSVSY